MAQPERFDDIVLGGGKGGKSLAMALAAAGHHVALIEKGQIGGTCINVACIPTKTMVASAKLIDMSHHAKDFGVSLPEASTSLTGVIDRKRRVVKKLVDNHMHMFTSTPNMSFILGTANFSGPKTIDVKCDDGSMKSLTAERIYINTGSRSAVPPIEGLSAVPYLTSTSVMELSELPEHLVIVGGGYIALEFAQIYRRLGSRVTVLLRGDRFLPNEDEDIADAIRSILADEGIEFKSNVATQKVNTNEHGIEVHVQNGSGPETLHCNHILIATGRSPNTEELNLQAAGVQTDRRGNITVNEKLETNIPGIWAIGDCNGGPLFTHVSWDDFRIIRDNVLHDAERTTAGRLVPYTLFIDPELGRVGMTEQEARAKGIDILVAKLPADKIPRSVTSGETKGVLKAVVDKQTKQILGCSLLCHSAGEVMSVVQMAMIGKVPYTEVRNTIFTHPTMAESLNLLFATI